jgi:hypothetical protein
MAALTYRSTTVNPIRRRCAISIALVAVALAGCGGDDDEPASTPTATTPTATEPVPTTDSTEPEAEEVPTVPTTPPEEQTGGAGDEIPAESLAVFTGRAGRITPRVVRVPAFISIRVELRSADDAPYVLRFRGRALAVRSEIPTVSRRFNGLRPGAAIVGTPVAGTENGVRVEATAEPGP